MIEKSKIKTIVEENIQDTDFFIVDISISSSNKIRVIIDGMKGVGIDDCVRISRAIESNFDREQEDFELEVSSFGIGQPLKKNLQYEKNLGRKIEITDENNIKHQGILKNHSENSITIEIIKKIKEEGAKRKKEVTVDTIFELEKIKSTVVVPDFGKRK